MGTGMGSLEDSGEAEGVSATHGALPLCYQTHTTHIPEDWEQEMVLGTTSLVVPK